MAKLLIKGGAEPQQLLLLIAKLVNCATQEGLKSITITEGTGGKHSPKSLHYKGRALDVRSSDVPNRDQFLKALRAYFGPDYDVVFEGDHFHIEFDPQS